MDEDSQAPLCDGFSVTAERWLMDGVEHERGGK